jgi:hypothetical protein
VQWGSNEKTALSRRRLYTIQIIDMAGKIGAQEKMVPRGGIEPPTLRFSVACSTN